MTWLRRGMLGLGVLLAVGLAGRFVYYNLVVPWPYRHELKACLSAADAQLDQVAVDEARNVCFRTYPHFN